MGRWVAVPARDVRALTVHRAAAPCRACPSFHACTWSEMRPGEATWNCTDEGLAQQGTCGGSSGGEHPASQGPAPGSTQRDRLGTPQCHSHRAWGVCGGRGVDGSLSHHLLRGLPCLLQAPLSPCPNPASLSPTMHICVLGGITVGPPFLWTSRE